MIIQVLHDLISCGVDRLCSLRMNCDVAWTLVKHELVQCTLHKSAFPVNKESFLFTASYSRSYDCWMAVVFRASPKSGRSVVT